MIVYLFDSVTFQYAGVYVCQESPLEPGEYVVPEHSTTEVAPAFDANIETCTWTGSLWDVAKIVVIVPPIVEQVVLPPVTIAELQLSLTAIQTQITALSAA